MANDFQVSMGLESMPTSFWQQSIFEKPRDRAISCHASAWDFCDARDYRIKQCTEVTQEEMINAHHELGHIQYNLQYRDQRFVFREGGNPAFHEAVGDVFALSASTPENMQRLGLLDPIELSFESDINILFTKALDKVAFLPFSYLVDKYRYEVFRGTTWDSNLNKRWWEWRLWAQGVTPPIPRDDNDFDAGGKYHIPAGMPYIKNFLAMVLQFQLHSELCRVSGHQGPLHRCNLHGSRKAGRLLSSVMRLGKSRPWNEVISTLTGGRNNTFEAKPMLEYFSQLHNWLKSQNRDEYIGWNSDETVVSPSANLSTASVVTLWVLGIIFCIIVIVLCIIGIKRCKRADRDVIAATDAAS
ncbi:unnamed protein product [Meganyctiphanes norvegica]|uniref:Angiotensin-converting enzyme n=1 Tax=Meganyctiphanes norvegica TaxID=48144 RepID=A0AAV2QIQ8_MEGNR